VIFIYQGLGQFLQLFSKFLVGENVVFTFIYAPQSSWVRGCKQGNKETMNERLSKYEWRARICGALTSINGLGDTGGIFAKTNRHLQRFPNSNKKLNVSDRNMLYYLLPFFHDF
jgi:uncharacterized protein involved in tellurium resistance